MEPTTISGGNFRTGFMLLLVAVISGVFIAVIWPFIQPLMMAALLSGLCHPLFRVIATLCGGRRSLASAITLLILFLIIVGPLSAFLGLIVNQALNVSEHAIPWLQEHFASATSIDVHAWLVQHFPLIGDFVPSQQEIVTNVGTATKAAGAYLVTGASAFTASTAVALLNFFVMIYAMFFFLKDGRKILEKIFFYVPMSHEDELRMLERFESVTKATVKGTLVIGLIQGTLSGIAFFVAGIDGAAFWGTVMVILSIVPGIGAMLVWIPAVLYLYFTGETTAAVLLGVWCAGVVGTIDNLLRPILVGKDAEMPDLLILIGTLGGLFLFGPIGFIFGPIVCGLFLTVWEIYGTAFRHILGPVKHIPEKTKKPAKVESEKRATRHPEKE